jgi:hypothetical protein
MTLVTDFRFSDISKDNLSSATVRRKIHGTGQVFVFNEDDDIIILCKHIIYLESILRLLILQLCTYNASFVVG